MSPPSRLKGESAGARGAQASSGAKSRAGNGAAHAHSRDTFPGQIVLVLQGGGALGAYQAGVFEALHEAGVEPDWVIGTSIGAINAAIIAGNTHAHRLDKLREFWARVEQKSGNDFLSFWSSLTNIGPNLTTVSQGIPCFFTPHLPAWLGMHSPLGVEAAAYYTTAPLASTLSDLVDVEQINKCKIRLTVGAVNVRNGEMRYFDSREEPLAIDHVLASGALPPAFPAVRIDGDPYWDGGIFSNTPIEAVLDDNPRKDSVIFNVQLWNPEGPEPETLWQVMGKQKDIQYASRSKSHIARQKQIHHLRHVIREMYKHVPEKLRSSPEVRELNGWGCGTTMHIVRLLSPGVEGEDHTKDIDFTPSGIRSRWQAGYSDTMRMLKAAPWRKPVDPVEGVIIHQDPARPEPKLARGIDGFSGRTR